jgi:hypothetical protein
MKKNEKKKKKTLSSIRDNHQEELAKFGYGSERKVAKSQLFWGQFLAVFSVQNIV